MKRQLSTVGAHLIESFEGFEPEPYKDAVGVWTIGFGSTKGVGPSTKPMTRAQAEQRMMREIDAVYGAAVNAIGVDLNQNQFDALVSFVYNVGPGGIGPHTGIGQALRDRNFPRAANELLEWDKAGGQRLAGLTRRRQAERELFLKEDRWKGYTENEIRWIREYDRHPPLRRRLVLRAVMRAQAKRIRNAAKKSGWTPERKARVKSLEARS
jgi:GH24 family phage-related lysozyme (muramidase)